jgi:hypothetical protein
MAVVGDGDAGDVEQLAVAIRDRSDLYVHLDGVRLGAEPVPDEFSERIDRRATRKLL